MNRFKSFIKSTIIGGITVILPIALLVMIFKWLFKITTKRITISENGTWLDSYNGVLTLPSGATT